MSIIKATARIDAPIGEVFEYLARPENHVEVMPSLIHIDNVEGRADGGSEGEFTFKMLGMKLEGRFEDVEFVPPERRVYRLSGDVIGSMEYHLRSEGDGTHVELVNDTELSGPAIVGKVTEPITKRYLKREMGSMAENLKLLLETRQSHSSPAG